MKIEAASLMNNEELRYFLRKFFVNRPLADTIIIHYSLFIIHFLYL